MPSTVYFFRSAGNDIGFSRTSRSFLIAVESHRQLSLLLDIQGAGADHRQAFAKAAQGELAVRVGHGRFAMAPSLRMALIIALGTGFPATSNTVPVTL